MDLWVRVRRLDIRLAARGLGVVPPLTVLSAAATLVGDDEVRWADVTADVVDGTTRWLVVVLTPYHLVTVEASSHVVGWSYDNPGPDAEATAAPTVSAAARRLSSVTAVPSTPVRLEWRGGEVTLPLAGTKVPTSANVRTSA